MKKTRLLLFLFFLLLSAIPCTQDIFSQSQFQLVIGDSSNIGEARCIIQTSDGGYIAAGESDTFGDMYIVKLNSSGQIQWSKTIGGFLPDIALSISQTAEGGFIVSGYSESFHYFRSVFIKLTQYGNIEWTRGLNAGDPAWDIVQTTDGGYAAVISPTEGGGSAALIIVKLNSLGILQWSKRIG
jgi:hypothetical protein